MVNTNDFYHFISTIPKGKVTTYGLLAEVFNLNPRMIGRLLHSNPEPGKFPCHRVVNAEGKLASHFAFGGLRGQTDRLEAEGIKVINGRVNLQKYLWQPK